MRVNLPPCPLYTLHADWFVILFSKVIGSGLGDRSLIPGRGIFPVGNTYVQTGYRILPASYAVDTGVE